MKVYEEFEYLVKEFAINWPDEAEEKLNALGANGWKLVGMIQQDYNAPFMVVMVFIRRKTKANAYKEIQSQQNK